MTALNSFYEITKPSSVEAFVNEHKLELFLLSIVEPLQENDCLFVELSVDLFSPHKGEPERKLHITAHIPQLDDETIRFLEHKIRATVFDVTEDIHKGKVHFSLE